MELDAPLSSLPCQQHTIKIGWPTIAIVKDEIFL